MQKWLRELVFSRAEGVCEYCHRPAWSSSLTFTIDHIRALRHGGLTVPGNLALACPECNTHKGADLTGVDPASDEVTLLFNPRHHHWDEHFRWVGVTLVGMTAIGRTTIKLLHLNSEDRLKLRRSIST